MTAPRFLVRLRRLWPYFADARLGIWLVLGGSLVAALTEPLVPALLKPLIDSGFNSNELPLWIVPVVVIGIFTVRGAAGFVAQYGLSWSANLGMLNLRRAMFDRLMDAAPTLFAQSTASSLTNTLAYEVQTGTNSLVYSLQTMVRDALMLVALLAYLLWLNWQLTIFVAILIPGSGAGDANLEPAPAPPDDCRPGGHRRTGLCGRGKRDGLANRAPARREANPDAALSGSR